MRKTSPDKQWLLLGAVERADDLVCDPDTETVQGSEADGRHWSRHHGRVRVPVPVRVCVFVCVFASACCKPVLALDGRMRGDDQRHRHRSEPTG